MKKQAGYHSFWESFGFIYKSEIYPELRYFAISQFLADVIPLIYFQSICNRFTFSYLTIQVNCI